ncbi:MAG: DUF362 domain-containing protein [Candidatus Bathyarchaeota archaeon]|nr:DUF362 domain-containing protein [Candidatus Bathyarchaeota archaeon]
MGDVVGLVRAQSSEEIKNSIGKALDLINFKPKGPVKAVDIKANLCYYWHAATGYTTDPRIVAGIIDCVRERHGADTYIRVVEADATAMRTKHAFLMLGYEKLAKEKNVELFNLSKDEKSQEKVRVNGHEIAFQIPQSLLKSDLFINVPKLKIMRDTKITCALKNVFGCIASPRKIVYHPILSEAIVGINKILHPHLTIVDGLVALGRFPIKLGLIMVSTDPFSIDWIASQIMGYNPSEIKFLKIAMKEKLGNLDGIMTRGENIIAFKKIFPKENFFSSKRWWNVQLGLFKLYSKVVKDVVPPMLEKDMKS